MSCQDDHEPDSESIYGTEAKEANSSEPEMIVLISGQTSYNRTTTATPNQRVIVYEPVELLHVLHHFLNSKLNTSIRAAELLVMCTGLEGSKQTEIIKKALQVEDIATDSSSAGFSSFGFTANSLDPTDSDQSVHRPELRIMPNIENFEVACFSAFTNEMKGHLIPRQPSTTQTNADHDQHLQELNKKYQNIKNRRTAFSSTHIAGLLNLWDIGLNRSVRPFLETVSSCFTDHAALFLFINIDDIEKLYAPPIRGSMPSEDFSWRPKIQYLLRPVCQLRERSENIKCTIFLTYNSSNPSENNEVQNAHEKLSKVCEVAFQQMEIQLKYDVCKIAYDKDCRLLLEKIQTYAKEMNKADIPLSHLLLRSILPCAFKDEVCITRKQLEDFAKKYLSMDEDKVKTFRKSFTAFGSILDISQVNPECDYVIIKPNVFLDNLQQYIKKINEDGSVQMTPTVSGGEEQQIVDVLIAIGMAYRYTDGTRNLPKLSSAFAFNEHVMHKKRAIQFVLNMGNPRLNMNIDLMKYLITDVFPNQYKILHPAANVTTIRVQLCNDYIDVCFTFLAEVIEVSFDISQHVPHNEHIREVCGEVIAALKQIVLKKCKKRGNLSIKYQFAVLCQKDEIRNKKGQSLMYSAYRIRHVLPGKLCELCCDVWGRDETDLIVVDTWRQLLDQGMDGKDVPRPIISRYCIPHELKLNGDLTMDNIVMLSKSLANSEKFNWRAVKILANELEVVIVKKEPLEQHRKELTILEMLMRWEHDNYGHQSDSLRKIMARRMHDAAIKCKELVKEKKLKAAATTRLCRSELVKKLRDAGMDDAATKCEELSSDEDSSDEDIQLNQDFNNLAKDLDMTVLTKAQRDELVKLCHNEKPTSET